ncbi:unnamed protein product [Effrenium voratum]|uniref:Uncharacterized protein n=1 Tax=Effrenium voratum TaxID=2562239 RepID=A0AA36HW57_9DINO|nr:unnamed protein product [Effrenium voratum]
MGAAVRWDIAREEEKFKKTEELKDELKVMQDRAEFKDGLEQLIQENLHTEIVKELRDKKQYQEFKRAHKKAQKQEELQKTTDGYLDQKDFSEWTVQNKRVQMQEEQRMLVEAHLDTKNFYQEYKAQEKARKDMEEKEDRFEAEHKDLQLAFFKASQEREMAMDALEPGTPSDV